MTKSRANQRSERGLASEHADMDRDGRGRTANTGAKQASSLATGFSASKIIYCTFQVGEQKAA